MGKLYQSVCLKTADMKISICSLGRVVKRYVRRHKARTCVAVGASLCVVVVVVAGLYGASEFLNVGLRHSIIAQSQIINRPNTQTQLNDHLDSVSIISVATSSTNRSKWTGLDVPDAWVQSILKGQLLGQYTAPRPPRVQRPEPTEQRVEPVERPVPEPKDPALDYRFVGVMDFVNGENGVVLIESIGTGRTNKIGLNQSFDLDGKVQGKLIRVSLDQLAYESDGTFHEVLLGQTLAGTEWQASGGPASPSSSASSPSSRSSSEDRRSRSESSQSNSSAGNASDRSRANTPANSGRATLGDSDQRRAEILRAMRERRARSGS